MIYSKMAFFYAHLSLLPSLAVQFFLSIFTSLEIQNEQQKRMPWCKGLVGKKNPFLILFLKMPDVRMKYSVTMQIEKQNNINIIIL